MSNEMGNILEAIGNTPLIRLNHIAEDVDSEIYVKLESMNPGGSTKDRIGISLIEAAEKEGKLQPGGTVIEATAGNTGVGLALVAAVKGYRAIFVMPDKMSRDKVDLLKSYGAEVITTPTSVPPDSPDSYNGVADRLAKEIPGSFRPSQFANENNPLAHYLGTGPEIWRDSGGRVEVLVAGIGTGGTISGTARYLRERNADLIAVGADPQGSILSGDAPGRYLVEGIGEDFIPRTFDRQMVDELIRVSDEESFSMARTLTRREGLLVGGSTGTAVAATVKYARRLKEPKYIVAIAPDTGRNYLSGFQSDGWMAEHGFLPEWPEPVPVSDVVAMKQGMPAMLSVEPSTEIRTTVSLLWKYNISQLPVVTGEEVVGSINESSLLKILHSPEMLDSSPVSLVMGQPFRTMDEKTDISEVERNLLAGEAAVIVSRRGVPRAVVTRADIIHYLMARRAS